MSSPLEARLKAAQDALRARRATPATVGDVTPPGALLALCEAEEARLAVLEQDQADRLAGL